MEKGGVTNHIHIRMLCAVFTEAFHGIFVGLGLSYIKGNLMLEVFPVVGNRIVHVYRVPDNVG